MTTRNFFLLFLPLLVLTACRKAAPPKLRVGYFPNLTHAQALIGISNGKFQEALGSGLPIEPQIFNAGPSAVEALFAGAVDLVYVGPSPAINAYVKSNGAFKIVAGAASGGAQFIVRSDSGIHTLKDLNGKKIATPQLGNTQDITARTWVKKNGFELKEKGGTVQILPVSNPDQLTLFIKKELDGAWTVEPWASRLIEEGGGRMFLDESEVWKPITGGKFATAVILVGDKFMKEHSDILIKWLRVHGEITEWIAAHPAEAKKIINSEIKRITGKSLPDKIIDRAFKNIEYTSDPVQESILQQGRWAFDQGFLGKSQPDLGGICDLSLLKEALQQNRK